MNDEAKVILLRAFRDAASSYGEAIGRGDSKAAKRHLGAVTRAYKELRQLNQHSAITALLTDSDLGVQYMTAVYALDFAPTDGQALLEKMVNGPPCPLGMLAQVSLSQWRAGSLKF